MNLRGGGEQFLAISREIDWHNAPPEKLPNLEQGLDIATYWLLTWGVPIT